MYKKVIKYTDYEGNERTEELYFHLKKSKIYDLELNTPGGIEKKIEGIVKSVDVKELATLLKDFMRMSYGIKSPDGKRFIQKVDGVPLFDEFCETEAYDQYYEELLTNDEEAARFVNGIIPGDFEITEEAIEDAKKRLGIIDEMIGDAKPENLAPVPTTV